MIQAIKDELAANPATYDSLSDDEVVTALKLISELVNKDSMTRQEVLEEIDPPALAALAGDDAIKVFGILSDSIDPFGNAAQVLIDAFGGGSQTIINLAAARKETIFPFADIKLGHVEEARS